LRAVLDPNVLISALLAPAGTPAAILRAWSAGAFELVASPLLLAELERALAYPNLRASIHDCQRISDSGHYVAGVSTRKVDQVVEPVGLRVSKSEVSRVPTIPYTRSWDLTPSGGGKGRAAACSHGAAAYQARGTSTISLSVSCLNPCDFGAILGNQPWDQPGRYRPICRHFGAICEA
jgi:hypothetical protein